MAVPLAPGRLGPNERIARAPDERREVRERLAVARLLTWGRGIGTHEAVPGDIGPPPRAYCQTLQLARSNSRAATPERKQVNSWEV